jgi:hypothetical protein
MAFAFFTGGERPTMQAPLEEASQPIDDEGLRAPNGGIAAHESEGQTQKQETEASWGAKVQRVEELNRSTHVTDALPLCVQAVGVDIANSQCERQTAGDDRARFDRDMSHLTKLDRYRRGSAE